MTAVKQVEKYMLQKSLPHAIDIEQYVLGVLMLDGFDAFDKISTILQEESFYAEAHQIIFHAIKLLRASNNGIDILEVRHTLSKLGLLEQVGNVVYLSQLTNIVGSGANIEYKARLIKQKQLQRDIIKMSYHNIKHAFEDTTDVFNLISEIEKNTAKLTEFLSGGEASDIGSLASSALRAAEAASKREDGLLGVPSGFTNLDRLLGGWQKNTLTVIAARPGMGKTAIALEFVRNSAIQFSIPTAFFSLEMSKEQITNRIVCAEANIGADIFMRGKMDKAQWDKAIATVENLGDSPILIDDTPSLTIPQLSAKVRRLQADRGIRLVVIDYLQLMRTGNNNAFNDEQRIAEVSRRLKELSKDLDIPVIALAQLNRAVEVRGGAKRPSLSDLRGSGSIEMDADTVIGLYRPAYYGIVEDENGNNVKNETELIVLKNRAGATDTIKVRFDAPTSRFVDDIEDSSDTFLSAKTDKAPINFRSQLSDNIPF